MEELLRDQENLIEKYFKELTKNMEFKKAINEREQRKNLVASILKQDKLKEITEIEFGELISNLWASAIWSNKDFLVQKIISDNGMDKIRNQLESLIYGEKDFAQRFDEFDIKGLGPSSVTEILCLFDSTKYGIWNVKAREALGYLKFNDLPLNKNKITGEEYIKINTALSLIAKKLQLLGLENVDLLVVDYFLYEVCEKSKKVNSKEEIGQLEFDHDEVRDYIRDIGIQLGFEVNTEEKIFPGAIVDVVWRAKIANLGMATYVFEVQKKGSIDSLILNLQKASSNPTVQKIVAVSDEKQIEKIKNEIEGLPENFRKILTFWEMHNVVETYKNLSEAMRSINKLELVKSQFEV